MQGGNEDRIAYKITALEKQRTDNRSLRTPQEDVRRDGLNYHTEDDKYDLNQLITVE